jgi:hypothetical protein
MDNFPLAFPPAKNSLPSDCFIVLSINLLSQKLVGDELPSYRWKHSEETKEALLQERYRILKGFLEGVHEQTGRVDIINF